MFVNEISGEHAFSNYTIFLEDKKEPEHCYVCSTKSGSIVCFENRDLSKLNDDEISNLVDEDILVKNQDEERSQMRNYVKEFNEKYREVTLQLSLTSSCNLACTYCFQGSHEMNRYISSEVLDGAIKFIKNHISGKELDTLRIIFYGGECLLMIEAIEYVCSAVKSFGGPWNLDLTMTTNGTMLTHENIERIKKAGINRVTISVGGMEHDRDRPYRDGKGSFSDILSNIKYILANDLMEVNLNCNYLEDNYKSSYPPFLKLLHDESLADKINRLNLAPVINAGSGLGLDCKGVHDYWTVEAGLFLREEALKYGFKMQETVYPYVCAVEQDNFFYISMEGSLFKCPALACWPQFEAGNVFDGVKELRALYNLDNYWQNDNCLSCSYLPLCKGGCRYMSYLAKENFRKVDCRKKMFDLSVPESLRQDIEYCV